MNVTVVVKKYRPIGMLFQWLVIVTMCQLTFASYPNEVYKCCPNGFGLNVKVDPITNDHHEYNCAELTNFTDHPITINLKHHAEYLLPECSDMELARLDNTQIQTSTAGCIDFFNGALHHLICPDGLKVSVQHVQKCCPQNFAYDIDIRECVPTSDGQSIYLTELFGQTVSVLNIKTPQCMDDEVFVEFHVNHSQLNLYGGGLRVQLENSIEEYLPPGSFCLDDTFSMHSNWQSKMHATNLIVRGCTSRTICRRIPCVRKCCKTDQVLERVNGSSICLDFRKSFRPTFYDVKLPLNVNDTQMEVKIPEYGFLETQNCKKFALSDDPDESHYLSHMDGNLHVANINNPIDINGYCMEYFNGITAIQMMTFVCFAPNPQAQFKYYAAGLTISSVFLVITLIVYACLPKLLNLHGKTVVCHVLSLLAAYISLAIVQFSTEKLQHCFIVALLIYFCFLAAFCWQSVMCFDIWWTFGSIRVSRGMRKPKEMRRFLFYSLYAWGVPTVLSLLVYFVDIYEVLPNEWTPRFGKSACWFGKDNWRAHFTFFLLPVGLHIATNAVLFGLTAIHCSKVKGEIHRMQASNDSDAQKIKKRFLSNKTKYIMNIKLFVVMGVSWTLEIFAALLPQFNTIWYFSDAFNVFQGVLVFIIFVFKAKVWLSIQQKLGYTTTKGTKSSTLATATSFLTGSKENLHSTKPQKMLKSSSYSTLASSSVNLTTIRQKA